MAFAAILLLYGLIGVLAVIGTVTITRKRFSPRAERLFFALLLIPIAAMYLAFVDHFQSPASLRNEAWAAVGFAALALIGIRVPLLLAVGYALHGGWDIVHEWSRIETLTPIPLAYGAFCLAYDVCAAAYIYKRRAEWR